MYLPNVFVENGHRKRFFSKTLSQTFQPLNYANESGRFEKKPPKTWRLGPQSWRFPKYMSNKTKKGDYFCNGILSYYSFGNKEIWWLSRETVSWLPKPCELEGLHSRMEIFLKRRLFVYMWTNENGCFRIRWWGRGPGELGEVSHHEFTNNNFTFLESRNNSHSDHFS